MDQKRKALTPGAATNQGAPSIAVLGEGRVRDAVLGRYMAAYYRWQEEEGEK